MTKQESPFFVGQQAQVTESLERWVDDPNRPGQRYSKIRVSEDRITPVVITKVATKYVYADEPGEKRSRWRDIQFDKLTGFQRGDFTHGRLETPEMYRDRKERAVARDVALSAIRAATTTGPGRRRLEEAVGVHQYEAIALVLGEFRLTGPQHALLDDIWQRLTPDEQEVWETLLDYLPNEMRDSA